MKAKRILFGISAGMLLGLIFDGFLLVNSSGWLLAFLFPVVIPPLLGLAIGAVVGWKFLRLSPPWPLIVFVVLLSPLGVIGPIKMQEARFRRFAQAIPAYPESERSITQISVLGGDDPPRIGVQFRSTAEMEDMVAFYRDYLIEDGWTKASSTANPHDYQFFHKGHYTIEMIAFDSDQAGEFDKYDTVRLTRWFNTLFYRRH